MARPRSPRFRFLPVPRPRIRRTAPRIGGTNWPRLHTPKIVQKDSFPTSNTIARGRFGQAADHGNSCPVWMRLSPRTKAPHCCPGRRTKRGNSESHSPEQLPCRVAAALYSFLFQLYNHRPRAGSGTALDPPLRPCGAPRRGACRKGRYCPRWLSDIRHTAACIFPIEAFLSRPVKRYRQLPRPA